MEGLAEEAMSYRIGTLMDDRRIVRGKSELQMAGWLHIRLLAKRSSRSSTDWDSCTLS